MYPLVITSRNASGTITTSVSTGILVNADGWLLTAGHVVESYRQLTDSQSAHAQQKQVREEKIAAIKANKGLTPRQKHNRIKGISPGPEEVTNVAFVFLNPNVQPIEGRVDLPSDLGLLKLDGLTLPDNYKPPRFRESSPKQGEMLCRAGFPFYAVTAGWARSKRQFTYENLYPMPIFVNEAIVSQFADVVVKNNELPVPYRRRLMRTSTPGLKGQSGGPLVDPDAVIGGIQTQTENFAMDFSPTYKGRQEHQFLNVGVAATSETVLGFLTHQGIQHYTG